MTLLRIEKPLGYGDRDLNRPYPASSSNEGSRATLSPELSLDAIMAVVSSVIGGGNERIPVKFTDDPSVQLDN
jgi:hypothetical protein